MLGVITKTSGVDEINVSVVVAIFLEQSMSMEEVKMFVDEALTMTKFDHKHVLNIVGIAFDSNSFPMVVLPFMQHGDLLSFIRDDRNVRLYIFIKHYSKANFKRKKNSNVLMTSDKPHCGTKPVKMRLYNVWKVKRSAIIYMIFIHRRMTAIETHM